MFLTSLRLFLVDPVKEILYAVRLYVVFLATFVFNTVLCRNIDEKTTDELLEDAFKIFKFLIFCILTNIAINEAFFNKDSNLINDLKSEVTYLIFFYTCFISCFYLGQLYGKISKNPVHAIFLSINWLMVMLVTTLVFQLTGILNPDHVSENKFLELISGKIGIIILVYFPVLVFQLIRLQRKKIMKWYDLFFYLLTYLLFFFFLVVKGVIIEKLIA